MNECLNNDLVAIIEFIILITICQYIVGCLCLVDLIGLLGLADLLSFDLLETIYLTHVMS